MKNNFYKKRNGTYYLDKTKEEILASIDVNQPKTFLCYLEAMDYPYYKKEWERLIENCKNPSTIFGKYISIMRLASYKGFSFKDSDELNIERMEGIEL